LVDAVEFPFEVHDHAGRADVVLQTDGAVGVVECKKFREGLGTWCFAKSNLVSRVAGASQAVSLEGVHRLNVEPTLHACLRIGHHPTARQYNVCLEREWHRASIHRSAHTFGRRSRRRSCIRSHHCDERPADRLPE
jgi:hypothetical protein